MPVGRKGTIREGCGTSYERYLMSKLTLDTVNNIESLATINGNFDKLIAHLNEKVLYRDNPEGEPNAMANDLDMNGYDLVNIGSFFTEEGRFATVDEVDQIKTDVENIAAQVVLDKQATSDLKDEAFAAAVEADYIYDQFNAVFLGVKASDPTTSNTGSPLLAGMMYFRSGSTPLMRIYNGTTWQDVGSITSTTTNTVDPSLYATSGEATTGSNNTKVMTPLRTKEAITNQLNTDIKAGFTSTGPIVLPGDAASANQATRLAQVNSLISSAIAAIPAPATGEGRLLRIERFTSTGTFTKQAGDRLYYIKLIGGGGGGGTLSGYRGAGAGATAIKMLNASAIGPTATVFIGGGGDAGGGEGGFTGFAGVVANGGKQNGWGGEATGGDHNIRGGSGSPGTSSGYGKGGDSSLGGGGLNIGGAGADGAPNTGGGGSLNGNGGSGYAEIWVYS